MSTLNSKLFSALPALIGVSSIWLGAFGSHAIAQESSQKANVIEEVKVTARRVEESLQSVPLSVVAMSAESLEKRNISNLNDLNTFVPNLTIGSGGGFGGNISSIFIRGIGQGRSASVAESGVGTYVDGIFLGQSDGGLIDLIDAERIEVLRGPQGTLFGKNSIGGAVNYVSKRPTDELSGRLKFTSGDFDRLDVEGMINTPLSDTVYARIAALSKTRDGHVMDVFDPERPVDTGNTDSRAIRGQLLWDVNSDVQVNFSADWISSSSNGAAQNIIAGNPNAPRLAGSGEPVPTPTGDLYTSRLSEDTFSEFEGLGLSMVIDWTLGDYILKSITAYRTFDNQFAVDFDGSAGVLRDELVTRDHDQFQQEFQLQGSISDKVDYIIGAFLYSENPTDVRAQQRNSLGGLNSLGFDEETDSYAVFGEGNIHVTDKFDVTIGLRGTWEDKSIKGFRNGVEGSAQESFEEPTYRVSSTYQFNEALMGYASFATGFKSGGFNDRDPNPGAPFDGLDPFFEETAETFEIGVKSDFLDGRGRLNVAAFHTDYDDLQLSALVVDDVRVTNIGKAEIDGVEFDLTLFISEALQLNASGALMDARVTDDQGNDEIMNGSQLARSPDASYTIGLEHTSDLSSGAILSTRVDWGWKDDYRLSMGDNTAITQEAFGLLSARMTYNNAEQNVRLSIFGTNLTDEEFFNSGLDLFNTPFGATMVDVGRPREWGVSLEVLF